MGMEGNTYRTILFEEFDSEKSNLFGILSASEDSANERVYNDVIEKLSVHSFEEFLEKFAPKVYEKYEPASNEAGFEITYSTESSLGAIPLDIVSNSYYKMLLDLYRKKEKSGDANLKFNYDELFEQLTPRQEIEAAKNLRKQLCAAESKYYECRDKGESTDEARKVFNGYFKKVREQYGKSAVNLLPIAMADLDTKIAAADKLLAQNAGKDEEEPIQIPGSGYTAVFKEDGTLDVVPVQQEDSSNAVGELPVKQLAGGERKLLSAVIEGDYDKRATAPNSFVRSLVVSTYAPLAEANTGMGAVQASLAEVRQMQEVNKVRKNVYEKTFQSAKAAFIQAMTETVQKLLGMQIFFDHAAVRGELADGLIVANCSAGLLMRECKEKFTSFIRRVGHEPVKSRIWFGIVPGVSESNDEGELVDDEDEDLLGGDATEAYSHSKPQSTKSVSMNELRQLLSIMDDARIMTVFSFKADDSNGFLMSPKYVEEKRECLRKLNNRHAVYAYPNFTLTRQRFVEIIDDAEKLAIPSVYIDAAYVAAGLLVGSQQHSYLIERKLPVHRQLPCVRIDFENPAVRRKLVTKFNRESYFGANEDLRNAINVDKMGFVFSGDAMDGMQNTYVYIANTLYKSPGSERYRPIYATLVEDYVRAEYESVEDRNTRRGVERDFIKGKVAAWKKSAEGQHKNDVNLLLTENESIVLEDNLDTGKLELKIKLSDLEAALDDLDINVEQKA